MPAYPSAYACAGTVYSCAGVTSSTYTISSTASNITLNTGFGSNGTWVTAASALPYQNELDVSGNANFRGDVTIKGRDLGKMIDDINKRLAILVPDPAKLEKFEALRKAYDHYKMMEALCQEDNNDTSK